MAGEDRQIQAMIDFIERDAQEKAREYDDEAQALYDAEKANLVEAAKRKVASTAEDRKKQLEVEARVSRAMHTKEQRMRVMDARNDAIQKVKDAIKSNLVAITKDDTKYKQLLADLLRQSALAIQTDAVVQCRRADESIVASLLSKAVDAVARATDQKVKLSLDKAAYLDDEEAWGGVVLRSEDGKIVCNNSLAYRAEHCFAEQLPTIRHYMFHHKASLA